MSIQRSKAPFVDVAFSLDGLFVAVASQDSYVRFFRVIHIEVIVFVADWVGGASLRRPHFPPEALSAMLCVHSPQS